MTKEQKITVERAFQMMQEEWESDKGFHVGRRYIAKEGIRSSQISVLVAFLVKLDIIKITDVSGHI